MGVTVVFGIALLSACLPSPGYSASDPGEITCGCHDGQSCYDAAVEVERAARMGLPARRPSITRSARASKGAWPVATRSPTSPKIG